jgi:hypothetical protein
MPTPLGATVRGLVAGAVGTAAMDLYGYARARSNGETSSFIAWEFEAAEDWEKVSAPGQLGKRLIEAVTQQPLAARWAPLTNNVMHWGFGTGNAAAYGILVGSVHKARLWYGIPFGAAVWTFGYVVLPVAKLYKPIWEYDSRTLAIDLGAHLTYGLATAAAFALLS